MKKWRPSFRSLYVIPEIKGNIHSLEIILNRILPLRFHIGQEDAIIFLGNYIDGHGQSADVIECLLKIKQEYPDRAFFLRGKNEELLNKAFQNENDFDYWTKNGGISTIDSYIKLSGKKLNPFEIRINRLQDIIPKDHRDFISNLDHYKIIDNYCFSYAGFNHEKSIEENSLANFCFDDTSMKYLKRCVSNNIDPIFKDSYTFISSHNVYKKPILHSKYFMLGGTAPDKLLVFELNSMSACASKWNKTRIYPTSLIVLE